MKRKKFQIMGILNVTPDSFSDGGRFNKMETAVKKAKELEKEGADIIDIGGESTGPGSKYVKVEEELKRVIPILKEIRKHTKLPISIDTYKSKVAEAALQAGANMVNDVTALRGDKKMVQIIKKYGCRVVLMYSKDKTARTTIKNKKYKNVIKTIKDFLKERIIFAKKHGIKKNRLIIDPGMGHFVSALPEYSFEIIARLNELEKLKLPILLGVSKKSFLGGSIKSRTDKGTIVSAIAYSAGVGIIRTHDVKEIRWLKDLH